MTPKQELHSLRKWLKTLKRHFQLEKRLRESGAYPRLDPSRLPR